MIKNNSQSQSTTTSHIKGAHILMRT